MRKNAEREDRLHRSEGELRCNHGTAKSQNHGIIVNHYEKDGRLTYKVRMDDQEDNTYMQENDVSDEMVARYKTYTDEQDKN
jgi:hypothetical protein